MLEKQEISLKNLNEKQKEQIRLGLEKGLEVSWYINLEFNADQMEQLFLGLRNGINVNFYLNPGITAEEMKQIRLELESKK